MSAHFSILADWETHIRSLDEPCRSNWWSHIDIIGARYWQFLVEVDVASGAKWDIPCVSVPLSVIVLQSGPFWSANWAFQVGLFFYWDTSGKSTLVPVTLSWVISLGLTRRASESFLPFRRWKSRRTASVDQIGSVSLDGLFVTFLGWFLHNNPARFVEILWKGVLCKRFRFETAGIDSKWVPWILKSSRRLYIEQKTKASVIPLSQRTTTFSSFEFG
jgi:hypothetical protein